MSRQRPRLSLRLPAAAGSGPRWPEAPERGRTHGRRRLGLVFAARGCTLGCHTGHRPGSDWHIGNAGTSISELECVPARGPPGTPGSTVWLGGFPCCGLLRFTLGGLGGRLGTVAAASSGSSPFWRAFFTEAACEAEASKRQTVSKRSTRGPHKPCCPLRRRTFACRCCTVLQIVLVCSRELELTTR